ncbi:uncharacterized protein ccdc142 [Trichomycterus rosablanca]|uniref:uncharacterized protein ccdc142 n=1 Tax=Trichomycterus rosablanca TaxID=2290929 RepID=UPI002F35F8AB
MAHTSCNSQESQSGAEPNTRTQTHPQNVQKPLPKAELRNRFGPNLKNLLRRRSDEDSLDYENEDSFVACEDLTSRSSLRLQHLELTLLGLSSQCHVLQGAGGCPRGHVKGLSTSEADFYHHGQAAAFSQHYAQLQHLLEQRAQLLFLHEYGRRCRAANCLLSRLAEVLERARLLIPNRERSSEEKPRSCWNLGLRGLCEELQVNVSHWDLLSTRWRSDAFLRHVSITRCREMLGSMRRNLWLLGLQALLLMEQCINTQLLALASAQMVCVPRDALEDLLSAVELYNHVIMYQRSQQRAASWSLHIMLSSGLPRKSARPAPFSVVEIMRILAQRRAHVASEKLYSWACQQTELVSLAGQPSMPWEDWIQATPNDILDESPKSTSHRASSMPFLLISQHERKEILETFLQALAFSSDLIATDAKHSDMKRNLRVRRLHRRPTDKPSSPYRVVQELDSSMTDPCLELFSQYSKMYWTEFPEAFRKHFCYQFHDGVLGGVNQWNYQMVFLLVKWLRRTCKEESIPEECKDVLRKICSSILSTAAFMRWDEMMCKSLGSGLKDKCLPGAVADPTTVRTVTMKLTLQLFPPLLSVIQLLQTPHNNPGEKEPKSLCLYYLGLLWRAQATIQSSTFWVLSKAFQFLASWSVSKFLLVTQGDLKDLRETVEALALKLQDVYRGAEQQIVLQHEPKLTQAVSQLQAFSDLVLQRFSTDCKKMSVEIFEQTMPSAKHWRINNQSDLPSNPSEYAAFAAQSVIGQVLEGVQPLPDEARIPALVEAMTAFLEAWMEHILKQRIKFSIQGALQLKQDFNLIREFIRSEKYSLSEELYHRLLSLRVFHQMDCAIVCLLQQPVAKTYMPSVRWEPFRHCCSNTAQVVDQSLGSLNDLETMDNQATTCQHALTGVGGSVTPELGSTAPPESYLAVAQQEWLDLRIHTGSRWRIPGLRCFSKSEQ